MTGSVLAEAIRAVERLPLTDAERAEAVRRLLGPEPVRRLRTGGPT